MKGMTEFIRAYGSALAKERTGEEPKKRFRPSIAITRELGSGGRIIAGLLAERLGFEVAGKEIINEIAERIKVPKDLLGLLDERPGNTLEIFGAGLLHGAAISESDYDRALKGTLGTLLELGSLVIVGRGGVFVAKPGQALRVMVVAPLERRVQNYVIYENLSEKKAREKLLEIDAQRHHFHKRHFGHTEVDSNHYDLTINTEHLSMRSATEVILAAYRELYGLPS